jgi:hypothetical protein
MSCLLWEDTFYEGGVSITERVKELLDKVSEEDARNVMMDAKFKSKLRHMPLYLLTLFAEEKWLKKDDVAKICTRADDMAELLVLYWKNGKKPLCHQMIKGLVKKIPGFSEYALAKYNRAKAVSLRDVFRIARPVPKNDAQSALWKRVVTDSLKASDTWKVAISPCGGDSEKKAKEFTRFLLKKSGTGKPAGNSTNLGIWPSSAISGR